MESKATAEKLSFFQLFSKKGFSVEIPIIQRDYAQGRSTAKDIREQFLNSLFYSLDEDKNIDLDFVYGTLISEKTTKFIPLDGQQRLTTLFLLHWYLAEKEDSRNILNQYLMINKNSKFTYETRASSKEFCNGLLNCEIDFTNLLEPDGNQKNSLSKTIKDCSWYFLSWHNDPTVQSMLVMLDAIHDKFKSRQGFFNKLIRDENPIITFQFLNLDEFKLTDDLYIKMNARGKPLTPFEDFKAKFEQLIKDTKFDSQNGYYLNFGSVKKPVSIQEYFSHQIDTEWSDLFWNYRDKVNNIFDAQIMNLIRVAATNTIGSKSNAQNQNNVKIFIDRNGEITFNDYKVTGSFTGNFIPELIEMLDFFKDGINTVKIYLPDFFYYDERSVFKNVVNYEIKNLEKRIQFYAYYKFLTQWKTSDNLGKWMRIIHNLTENTIYNDADDYIRSIKSVDKQLPHSNQILDYLAINPNIDGFNIQQIQEEKIKALLILKEQNWANAIYEIEQHEYFKGQIEFILKFSGILDFYNKSKKLDWNETEDLKFFNLFIDYCDKAKAIFGDEGLKEFKDHIFERALLTKGGYILYKNRNYSFLINGTERDISWKRLLRGAGSFDQNDTYELQRNFIKQVFDDSNFNIKNVELGLQTIVEQNKNISWRKYFIELPELFSSKYIGEKRFIRFTGENDILLLTKQKTSGLHYEYYTLSFYLKYLEGNISHPFRSISYNSVSGEDNTPWIWINEWFYKNFHFCIQISPLDKDYFKVYFYDSTRKEIPLEVDAIFKANNFQIGANNDLYSKIKIDDLISILITLRKALSELAKP